MKALITACFLAIFFAPPAFAAEKSLVVHEWGTFTSLQNDAGETVAGVNTDDEPVPPFVHDVGNAVALANSELSPVFETRARTTKGSVPRLHPDVTMRLETPLIYFYLPTGEKTRTIDVNVSFKGGWLSQFYPLAETNVDGAAIAGQRITPQTLGTLSWKGLEVGASGEGPATQDKVWLAPRRVKAATLRAAGGENEKFLFYRGVGHVASPLKALRKNGDVWVHGVDGGGVHKIWRVDVRAGGKIAYRGHTKGERHFGPFTETDYSHGNLKALRQELHGSLVSDGLYADEATAMLNTWEYSYFKAPGERIFYLVPRSWTDRMLPLDIRSPAKAPAKITRVVIGRIELLNAAQQLALERMRKTSLDGIDKFIDNGTEPRSNRGLFQAVAAGKKPISALGADVPSIYKDYLRLGRFRDAVLLDENAKRPHPTLAGFIRKNDIAMHRLP